MSFQHVLANIISESTSASTSKTASRIILPLLLQERAVLLSPKEMAVRPLSMEVVLSLHKETKIHLSSMETAVLHSLIERTVLPLQMETPMHLYEHGKDERDRYLSLTDSNNEKGARRQRKRAAECLLDSLHQGLLPSRPRRRQEKQ